MQQTADDNTILCFLWCQDLMQHTASDHNTSTCRGWSGVEAPQEEGVGCPTCHPFSWPVSHPKSGRVLWPPEYGASTQHPIRATVLARESHGAPHTEHGKTRAPSGVVARPMAAGRGAM